MPRTISDVQTLKEYISGIMERSQHHATKVADIVLPLAGVIVWKGKNIRAYEKNGEMKNVLWVNINEHQYAFAFNHTTQTIDIRPQSMRNKALRKFDNSTSIADILRFFETL